MSHTDISDIDRGHIFRKHRHKNNKKVAVIYEKMVKNRSLLWFLQVQSNPRRLFSFHASSNAGHYQSTLTSHNDRVRDVMSAKCLFS